MFLNKVGDEFHNLLECSFFEDAGRVYLPRNLLARPNVDTFRSIMCPEDTQRLFKEANFCTIILNCFKKYSETFSVYIHINDQSH